MIIQLFCLDADFTEQTFFQMFFRELPDPLCTLALHEQLVRSVKLETLDLRRAEVCFLLSHLPPTHLDTLDHLVRHLHLLSLSSSLTGMTPRNLAIVWAPNLLRSGALVDEIRDIGAGSKLVELLITEAPHIFQETHRLQSDRLQRENERLSSEGLDGKSQKCERHCFDSRSILAEETLLCPRLYPARPNIGHKSDKQELQCEGSPIVKRGKRVDTGGRWRQRDERRGRHCQVRSFLFLGLVKLRQKLYCLSWSITYPVGHFSKFGAICLDIHS